MKPKESKSINTLSYKLNLAAPSCIIVNEVDLTCGLKARINVRRSRQVVSFLVYVDTEDEVPQTGL